MGRKSDTESLYLLNHSKCMLSAFQNFRQDETMLDVTLVCNGQSLKAHKLILASCSQFFKELFSENPCKHPIVILRHFEFEDLKACIDFMYKGELSVPRERLVSALKMAEDLNIRGLMPSGSSKEVYKKLYDQFCTKVPHRKKRKRHRHNSRDSQESDYIKVSDSDHVVESDADNQTLSESEIMDVESVRKEGNSVSEKEIRPLVLHVGDLSENNKESIARVEEGEEESNEANLVENNLSADDVFNESSSVPNDINDGTDNYTNEKNELSSQLETYTTYSENSNQEYVHEDEQNNCQDQSMESESASENLEKNSAFMSCLSSEYLEAQPCEETKPPDEGKRFICSKCDRVFTSRINFMRHKALGHNNMEQGVHKCEHCTFTTEDMNCLKQHLLTHADSVPYKCNACSEEFTSEEVYQKHISLHEVEEIALRGISAVDDQDLFSSQSNNSAKNLEFRCSICFVKFSSKLRCQIHEKTCQGDS